MAFANPVANLFANAVNRSREEQAHVISEPDCPDDSPVAEGEPEILALEFIPRSRNGKRALQQVSTLRHRADVISWMIERVGCQGSEKRICAQIIKQFPEHFRASSIHANFMKVQRWWNDREGILAAIMHEERKSSVSSLQSLFPALMHDERKSSVSSLQNKKRRVVQLKAIDGRGRKRAAWTDWLYPILRDEFERLRNAGLKFSPGVLQSVAKNCLQTAGHPQFTAATVLPDSDKPLIDRINHRWIQSFQEHFNIVHRAQSEKLMISPQKQVQIEMSVAQHLGLMCGQFQSGRLDENLVENIDETHFLINMDNDRTLGFRGDTQVKYADVVSGSQGMTMVVKVTGSVHAKIGTPFMIFSNANCSYPINNVPDNVPGVCYRTTKKAFITSACLAQYYREHRVNRPDSSGRSIIQCTHLVQPADSFVISKIKDAWTKRWELKKMELIKNSEWQGDGTRGTSGALKNPGKRYFLQLAADSVADVNSQRDANGISYARKAMIRCGLSLNINGRWEECQLQPELQNIIHKYRDQFEATRRLHSAPLTVIPTPLQPTTASLPARIPNRLVRRATIRDCVIPDSQL
ncbi:hypothetical protein R1sor_009660 [Riccia sorocarpa]|uniref:Ndc10 domain-containing protein n=1 Tax=Riccia sorocarpa TaxID=122646 RepID=A0ABD3I1U8_9MARC